MQALLDEIRSGVIEAHGRRTPLRLRGAGTKDFYGESCEGTVFELGAYRGVVDYEPSELVITARCGTRLSEIEALLAAQQQFLAFEPPGFGADPTIGGVVAAGLSGPRRCQAGAVRDFVLGAVLLAVDGELLHFGGRVMKNVAGFDVARLLCGSLGILGPITQVSLKVLPLPRAQQTLHFELPQDAALAALNRWGGQPLPISASAWWEGELRVRLSGAAAAVAAARVQLGGQLLEEEPAREWWAGLRSLEQRLFAGARSLWRLSVPSTAPPLALAGRQLIEWGGALRWVATERADAQVRAVAAEARGTALHWRGGSAGGRFHPLAPAVHEIHRRLKTRFDPHGIFNQNRLIPGL